MADDQGVKEVEGQSQLATTPVADQPVPAGPEASEQSPEIEGTDELGLPKGASERTRQRVQELLEENKQLKSQVLPVPEPMYEPIVPIAPIPAQGVPAKVDEFGNPNPAYIDYLESRVVATEQAVISKSVKDEAKEAENAHPEIKTNQSLLNIARGIKTDSIIYPESYGGRELSLKEALDFVKTQSGKPKESNTEEISPEKEQASLGIEGRPLQGVQRELSDAQFDELRWATAKGEKDALIARMRNIRQQADKS